MEIAQTAASEYVPKLARSQKTALPRKLPYIIYTYNVYMYTYLCMHIYIYINIYINICIYLCMCMNIYM